nr:hypothetical protein [Kofleriaceae bacterium]
MSAVLLDDRILRRVIKRHRRLPGIGLQVPHATSYALPRAELERLVDKADRPDTAGLADQVVAFTGSRSALAEARPDALSAAWRSIFHARVHAAFDALFATGALTAAAIRERVNRIGQTEFDEIRFVLRQEDLLLPPADDAATYIEFVALYLELQLFAPVALPRTFPTLADPATVADTIALDLDTAALLAASRPPGAPDAPLIEATGDAPATVAHAIAAVGSAPAAPAAPAARVVLEPSARERANSWREKGNRARAAILDLRAGDDDAARRDLEELAARLSRALHGADATTWAAALLPVARHAAQQSVLRFEPGARLLYDLQKACVVAEREEKIVDVVGWALSRGKQPVVRALPAAREVRVAKHLHAASRKIAEVAIGSTAEREALATAIHAMVEHAEANVRAQLRPKIEAALDGVELEPRNLPEKVAQKKVVDELLDHAVADGRLSIGNLRDALSHNDLKMTDLRLRQLRDGDQLLRADAALARSLDGVYQRGEVYLRVLQKLSSIFFGTPIGRVVSKYLVLPVLGSYAALEGAQHIAGPFAKHVLGTDEPEIATPTALLAMSVFLFLLLHVPPFRRGVGFTLRYLGVGLRALLYTLPRAIWRTAAVQLVRESVVGRWVLRPAVPAAIAYSIVRGRVGWPVAAAVFAIAAFVINSRVGRRVGEDVSDWLVKSTRHLARQLVPNLVRLCLDAFAEAIELLDRGIYRVDQWLRFRQGESSLTLVVKGVLGTLWFFATYLLRLYVNLFVEPVINPIKHFPTVTVAAKLTWPFSPSMIRALSVALGGSALADGFAAFTVFVIPGLAGFLVWELKENWKLYRASRPELVTPVAIGHHGETMGRFLRPGLHSGTIPKLYSKLRRAAWKRDERGVAKHREGLHHVEEAVEHFTDRELVSMLVETAAFGARDLCVHGVEIASNRVRIELACPTLGPGVVAIGFDEQSGWLVAGIRERGWLAQLDARRRAIFELALAGFYRLAGVDLVREQLESVLGTAPGRSTYDIAGDGLILWPGGDYASEVVYDLQSRSLAPHVRGSEPPGEIPTFTGRRALFGREAIAWSQWESAWERVDSTDGGDVPRVAVGPSILPAIG